MSQQLLLPPEGPLQGRGSVQELMGLGTRTEVLSSHVLHGESKSP